LDPLPSTFAAGVPSKEERTWAMIAHLSAFAGHIFPFAHIIAPLVVWLAKKETSAFVDIEGKEAVNAQITFTIYFCIAIVLCFVLIGIPMLVVLYLANVILVIVAAISAYDGRPYRYPFILRFVK
jgi:uncharacterized Tic20 family protein